MRRKTQIYIIQAQEENWWDGKMTRNEFIFSAHDKYKL